MFVLHEGIGNQDLLPFHGLRNDDHKGEEEAHHITKIIKSYFLDIWDSHVKIRNGITQCSVLNMYLINYGFILDTGSGSAIFNLVGSAVLDSSAVKKNGVEHENWRSKGSKTKTFVPKPN